MGGMGCCAVVIVSCFTELLRPRKCCSWVLLSGLMGVVTLLIREGEFLGDSQLGVSYGGVIWGQGSTNPACVKSLGNKEWKTPSFEVPQPFFLPIFKVFFPSSPPVSFHICCQSPFLTGSINRVATCGTHEQSPRPGPGAGTGSA